MNMDDLKRANESYAHAFDLARDWQNVDKKMSAEIIRKIEKSGYTPALKIATRLLRALRDMSPSEVTTAKVSKLEDQLARIRAIAEGEHD